MSYPTQQYPVRTRQPSMSQSSSTDARTNVYPCLYPHPEGIVAFSRHADLQRHVAVVHGQATLERIDCVQPGCHRRGQYGFSRKDKMVDHMREVHKSDIPKRAQGQQRGSFSSSSPSSERSYGSQ